MRYFHFFKAEKENDVISGKVGVKEIGKKREKRWGGGDRDNDIERETRNKRVRHEENREYGDIIDIREKEWNEWKKRKKETRIG